MGAGKDGADVKALQDLMQRRGEGSPEFRITANRGRPEFRIADNEAGAAPMTEGPVPGPSGADRQERAAAEGISFGPGRAMRRGRR